MGSGYYDYAAQDPTWSSKTEEQIAEEIITDIQVGVDDTGVCAGVIGEIGCSWPLHEMERKSLCAAAYAQQETGAPINIDPGRHENSPREILEILDNAGADLSRVVISHIDRFIHSLSTRCELAKSGCFLEYDQFGTVSTFVHHSSWPLYERPCDRERIEQIKELIDEGYLNQILISQDVCLKTRLTRYGGNGYAYIQRIIVQEMLARGITREQIYTMQVANPKRMFG
jgi:phosphotriesterase-related protein